MVVIEFLEGPTKANRVTAQESDGRLRAPGSCLKLPNQGDDRLPVPCRAIKQRAFHTGEKLRQRPLPR